MKKSSGCEFEHAYLIEAVGTIKKKDTVAVRRCLRCGGDFMSQHKFNRICEPCREQIELGLFDTADVFLDNLPFRLATG